MTTAFNRGGMLMRWSTSEPDNEYAYSYFRTQRLKFFGDDISENREGQNGRKAKEGNHTPQGLFQDENLTYL